MTYRLKRPGFRSCSHLLFFLAVSGCFAGLPLVASEQELQVDYFGCPPPPADRPVIFAPGIVSNEKTWEEKIAFTPDGKEVFFGRHPDASENYFRPKVMHARFADGSWSTPKVAAFSAGRNLGWPLMNAASDRLFLEEYEGKIMFTKQVAGQWTPVERYVPDVEAKQGFGLGQMTNDGTLYFHDRWDRIAYASKKRDGKYLKPEPLPARINPCVEFFVSPVGDYLIFQPLNWTNQLHISFRNTDGEWDMPIPFSTYFRGNHWDCKGIGPSLSPDGKYLFISKRGDIYWLKADFIETLRKYERPY